MRAVAEAARVSRSTLYRHFANPANLQHAVQQEALDKARGAVERALGERPPLAELRSILSELVSIGAELPIDVRIGPAPEEAVVAASEGLRPLAHRLARAADLAPMPRRAWVTTGMAHFVETCLRAAGATHTRPTRRSSGCSA
jgi:AcrR family transcriptional regulator